MNIRKLTLQDFDAFLTLEGYAFHYVVDEEREKKVRKIWGNSIGYGAFSDEGDLQSTLLIRPYEIFLHGKSIKMGGIGDVASYPEARGQGNVRNLFNETLKVMKEQKMLLSYLAPFSYRFYRKFGYELVFEERQYTIKPTEFVSLDTGDTNVRRVKWEDEKETLMSMYTQKHQSGIGPVNREEWVWQEKNRWVEDLYIALCTNESGQPDGYVTYHFKSEGTYTFVVDELVALSGNAEKALWQFIASHGPQFETVTYRTGAANNLAYLFPEPDVEQRWVPSMMARIVDMEAFLKEYPFKQTQNDTFLLKVTDETAEWNNGLFMLEVNDDGIFVNKVDENVENVTHKMSADIQTWTQLFMGTRTAEQLHFQGRLHTDGQTAQAFQTVLWAETPELYDYF